ncbi:MAG: Uncharacterized protein JWN03_8335 [Nocardia sp.]|uniref:hypothetical protein n=1 Tax=Nocardia sp. TaxID=1821 RepID=UPI00261A6BC0|nr:hypothetical protein [Nocardia sp.]MCU1648060.1 Uncharacterized protein [Nocardia sp.]
MMTIATKLCGATALVSAGLLLSSGCAVTGTSDAAPSASTTSAHATTTARADQLLLNSAEFPSGSSMLGVSEKSVVSGFSNASGTSNNNGVQGPLTVNPAECASAQQDLTNLLQQLTQNASFAGAQQGDGTVFTEIISNTAADLAKVSDSVTRCGQMTLTTTVLGKQVTTTTVSTESLPLPDQTNGLGAVAYRTTSQSELNGNSAATNSYTGYALVDSITVAVHAENLTGTSDESTFENLFGTAVQKVRDAT